MKREITITLIFNGEWEEAFGTVSPELIVEDALRELASGVTYELTAKM